MFLGYALASMIIGALSAVCAYFLLGFGLLALGLVYGFAGSVGFVCLVILLPDSEREFDSPEEVKSR